MNRPGGAGGRRTKTPVKRYRRTARVTHFPSGDAACHEEPTGCGRTARPSSSDLQVADAARPDAQRRREPAEPGRVEHQDRAAGPHHEAFVDVDVPAVGIERGRQLQTRGGDAGAGRRQSRGWRTAPPGQAIGCVLRLGLGGGDACSGSDSRRLDVGAAGRRSTGWSVAFGRPSACRGPEPWTARRRAKGRAPTPRERAGRRRPPPRRDHGQGERTTPPGDRTARAEGRRRRLGGGAERMTSRAPAPPGCAQCVQRVAQLRRARMLIVH